MRLWHEALIPYLDRQRLLGQHRECCALRGKGWGKKHATVDYVFTHDPEYLYEYHCRVMAEMERRGYHPDQTWRHSSYRGATLGFVPEFYGCEYAYTREIVYPEHDDAYLAECITLLKEKDAPINWELVSNGLGVDVC